MNPSGVAMDDSVPHTDANASSHGNLFGLWLIVTGNVLFSAAAVGFATHRFWLFPGPNPWFSWLNILLVGIISALIIQLALSMLLLEFRRSLKWITTLLILVTSAATISLAHILGRPWTGILNTTVIVQFGIYFAFALTIGVFTVLGLQVLFWPITASLGWQIRPIVEAASPANPKFSLLELFAWIGFIAALLSLIRTLAGLDDWWFMLLIFSLLWLVPALLAAVPTLLIAARAMNRPWWFAVLIPYLGIVSYLESEVTVIPFRLGFTGAWWPPWILLVLNLAIAVTLVANTLLLRTCGLVMDLPLWPRRVTANAGGAASASAHPQRQESAF